MANQVPSPEFLSLVQHVELSRSGWWDKALERFILAVFWMKPESKTAAQVSAEIGERFHIDLDVGRLGPQLDRLVGTKVLMQLPAREFVLGEEARREYSGQLDQATKTEAAAESAFGSIVAPVVPNATSDDLWRQFHAAFLVPLIKELGATTYDLLTGHALEPVKVHLDAYLSAYAEEVRQPLQAAVHGFLDPSNTPVRSYVLCLLNAYLILEAVSLSSADLAAVAAQLSSTPTFNVLVDTNFLLSILGLHDNPSNEAAQGLIRLSKALAGHVKVRFYVLPLTLEETQRVLIAHRDSLRGLRLSTGMAQAALNRASSSITVRFLAHVSKGGSPNSAEAYFEPYIENLLTILRSHGAELFNENIDRYRTRQDVIDDIALQTEYLKRNYPGDRVKSYEQLLHDTVLWHFANDKRPGRFDSPVEAGYWIVTLDHRLMGFDRFKQKGCRRPIPLCLEPTILSQLLQFWMPRSPELEQVVLGSIRMPLMFHAFDKDSERVTVDILRALGRYEAVAQLPRDAITAIVVNDALRARIGSSRSEEEKVELVKDALSAEFERTKSALDKAVEGERRARGDLEEKERALVKLKTELESAERAKEEAEKLRKVTHDLADDLRMRDEALESLRAQVAVIGEALDAGKRQRDRRRVVRQFVVRWVGWGVAVVGVAVGLASLPFPWLGLRYWSRVTLLATTAFIPWLWLAGRCGLKQAAVREWRVFVALQKLRTWVFVGLVATVASLFHELLAAWVQNHVWRP